MGSPKIAKTCSSVIPIFTILNFSILKFFVYSVFALEKDLGGMDMKIKKKKSTGTIKITTDFPILFMGYCNINI